MKCVIFISFLISTISTFANTHTARSNDATFTTIIVPGIFKNKLNREDVKKLRIKDFEKYTGKKLILKEKIAFKIVQFKLKKDLRNGKKPDNANKGKTAFILGLIGLVLVFIPYAIILSIPLAIIAIIMGNEAKKINPSDKKARAAVVLGWVTIGLFLLFLLIALIYLILILTLFA